MLNGIIFDSNSYMPLKETTVTIYTIKNEKVLEVFSTQDGTFRLNVNFEEGIYKVISFKEGYYFGYNLFDNIARTFDHALEIALRRRN